MNQLSQSVRTASGSDRIKATSVDRMMPSQCLVKTLLIRSLPLAVLTQPVLTRGLLTRFVNLHTTINQSVRIVIINNSRLSRLLKSVHQTFYFISRTAAAF